MAHDKGLLSSPEYGVMCQWYEYIETNVDIGLDLIGRNYTILIILISTKTIIFKLFNYLGNYYFLKSIKIYVHSKLILAFDSFIFHTIFTILFSKNLSLNYFRF